MLIATWNKGNVLVRYNKNPQRPTTDDFTRIRTSKKDEILKIK